MTETIDLLSGEVQGGGEQGLIVRFFGEFIGGGNTIYCGPDDGVVYMVFDPLAEQVDFELHLSHTLNILPGGFHPLSFLA
jgi:hypothetical protein